MICMCQILWCPRNKAYFLLSSPYFSISNQSSRRQRFCPNSHILRFQPCYVQFPVFLGQASTYLPSSHPLQYLDLAGIGSMRDKGRVLQVWISRLQLVSGEYWSLPSAGNWDASLKVKSTHSCYNGCRDRCRCAAVIV
jgi:hypothetical protein